MVGWKLGWLLLRKEKNRFVIAVAGIAFSTMLIFIQMGFENALYDGCMAPHKALNANLVMINPQFESFLSPKSFSRARLYQCLGFAEVESVESLHLEKGMFKNPQTRLSRNILVFGCDPLGHPFHLPGVEDGLNSLQLLNHVLFDNSSRPEYGRWKILLDQSSKVATEVNNKRIVVTGLFEMGASFAADGNILTSDSTFLRLFPQHLPDAIEVGLIRLSPGTSPAKVQQLMRSTLPSAGVELLTIEEFAEREHHYWATGSGIGFIFGLGVVVGLSAW